MKTFVAGLLALTATLFTTAVLGQAYPSKPIRLVVAVPAGSLVDGVARVIGPKLAEGLGQPMLVENKPGAGGSVGAAEVARAPADGHTLLLMFDTHAVNHHLYKNLSYDPFRSFEHVSLLVTSPQLLVAATNFPPSTVTELVAFAKANPGKVTYGSVGTGSSNHLNAVLLASRTGIDMLHIPYKGGAPLTTDVIGGHVNVAFVTAPLVVPQVKAGRLKALAIGSEHRISQLPNTPTVAETLPGFTATGWVGMLAPAGIPKEIRARLHGEVIKTLTDPKVRALLVDQGFEVVGSTPEDFLSFVQAESDKRAKVIRDYQIRVE